MRLADGVLASDYIEFDDLENFEGYDATTIVGEQHVNDNVNMED
ncbi:MAG: hypothetical protein Ta2A_12410 [Treponemataceae bacterium]|nr:MAG: hypothetical protein Ta2A_12410 [Treponemataceae bacterium]